MSQYNVGSSGGGGGNVTPMSVTVNLSAAQVKALFTSPVQLIAAGGPNTLVIPSTIVMQYDFATTPYTIGAGGNFVFYYSDINIQFAALQPEGLIDQTADTGAMTFPDLTLDYYFTPAAAINQPVVLSLSGSDNFTDGDSPIIVTMYYTVLTTVI